MRTKIILIGFIFLFAMSIMAVSQAQAQSAEVVIIPATRSYVLGDQIEYRVTIHNHSSKYLAFQAKAEYWNEGPVPDKYKVYKNPNSPIGVWYIDPGQSIIGKKIVTPAIENVPWNISDDWLCKFIVAYKFRNADGSWVPGSIMNMEDEFRFLVEENPSNPCK